MCASDRENISLPIVFCCSHWNWSPLYGFSTVSNLLAAEFKICSHDKWMSPSGNTFLTWSLIHTLFSKWSKATLQNEAQVGQIFIWGTLCNVPIQKCFMLSHLLLKKKGITCSTTDASDHWCRHSFHEAFQATNLLSHWNIVGTGSFADVSKVSP